jgi:hypothetical protein
MAAFSTLATIAALTFAAGATAKAVTQKVPKPPTPTPPPALPKPLDPNTSATVARQRGMSTAGGRQSTILTGASNPASSASTQRKTLIGY